MRTIQRQPLVRLGVAMGLSGALTGAAWWVGPPVLVVLGFVALTGIVFAGLTIAPDAIALRRGHQWRWWWRASDDDGPFWPGTRIPRGPRPPFPPPPA